MAGPGNIGYFMGGISKGIQSGISMGTQLTQLKWQKQKKKEIDDLNIKMTDTWNTISQEIVSLANDGQLSDDDKLKIYAMTMAAPYEMQSVMQNLRSSLSQFKTKDFENQMEYVKTFYDYAQGLDPKDIGSLYETVRNYITDPHALTLFEVADKRLRHEYEAARAEPTAEVFTSAEAVREKYPKAGVRYADEGYVPTFGEPTEAKTPGITDYNSAVNYLSKFKYSPPDIFNKMKTGFQSQFPNIDISAVTQESLREPEPEPTPPTAPAIESVREAIINAPTLEDAKRIEKNHIAKYGDTLDLNVDKFWSDERVRRLTSLKQGIDKLLDEKKRLKKGTVTSADVGFEIEDDIQKVEEVYRQLREEYTKYRDMLEKMGVDLGQFPELMSYEEYLKTDIKPGMGIFYPSTWGKQKPAIY